MFHTDEVLKGKTVDELRVLARKLALTGCSNLNKQDLVARIAQADTHALKAELFPTWWQTYHNHVYGAVSVLGVALSIIFFILPLTHDKHVPTRPTLRTVESPISFYDFSASTPTEKESLVTEFHGQEVTWEGYVVKFSGYDPNSIHGFRFDKDVSLFIAPTEADAPQVHAECNFGVVVSTDWGVELAQRFNLMEIGQRVRCSGQLDGTSENPVLREAYLLAVFPPGE